MIALRGPQVAADGADNEVEVVDGCYAELTIDALGNHMSLGCLDRLGAQFPVVAHSDEAIEEAAGRFEVQFDAPRAVAFARILG